MLQKFLNILSNNANIKYEKDKFQVKLVEYIILSKNILANISLFLIKHYNSFN